MSRFLRAILAAVLTLACNPSLHAQSWATKLGFPPDAKVIILSVRETGITWEANVAAQKLSNGAPISMSVVVTGPWSDAMGNWCRQHDQLDIGISVGLTNPYSAIHWRLLSSELGPSTLVDADGLPWKSVAQLAVSASAEDVKRELDAQIQRARKIGIRPTHISGYYGTIFSRTDLAAVLLGAARKYWLPAPVVDLTPEMIEKFASQGVPIDKELVELVQSYPLPKLDDLQVIPVADSYEQKRMRFVEQIKSTPAGLIQILCRPAVETEGLKMMSQTWQQRVWDAKLLSDPEVKKTMQAEQVILTNWREIMNRFEGKRDIKLKSKQTESKK